MNRQDYNRLDSLGVKAYIEINVANQDESWIVMIVHEWNQFDSLGVNAAYDRDSWNVLYFPISPSIFISSRGVMPKILSQTWTDHQKMGQSSKPKSNPQKFWHRTRKTCPAFSLFFSFSMTLQQ